MNATVSSAMVESKASIGDSTATATMIMFIVLLYTDSDAANTNPNPTIRVLCKSGKYYTCKICLRHCLMKEPSACIYQPLYQ